MQDVSNLTLAELRSALEQRAFSVEELALSILDRIEAFKDLNAFLEVPREAVLGAAREADKSLGNAEKPKLLGLPIAIKDLILTRGIKSTAGSRMLANFNPPYDATVTAKLKEAGAVIIGKTNLDEFGMGSSNENSAFGAVKNPWDRSRVPGGSSGGSAAAVAARLVPAALGTDTGGSIRQPASFCGIVGIKPTYGRVSRYGVIAYASSLDQVGVFARTVSDAAEVLSSIAGRDPHDGTSMERGVPDFRAALQGDIKGLRIGVPREYFSAGLDAEVERAVRAAVSELQKLGASVVEVSLPHTEAAVATYYIIAPAEASSNLSRYDGIRYGHRAEKPVDLRDLYCRSRSEGFGKEVQRRILVGTFVLSAGYYEAYYGRAQKIRSLIADDFRRVFEKDCDLIACPAAPTTAFKIGEKLEDPLAMYLGDVYTVPASLAGLPGMTVPCGFDRNGLPIGMQLIARPWEEETLLRAGWYYEQATDWAKRSPV